MCRELTRDERKGIRKLVTEMCANYDREYGCLPLDCECYMLGKCWTDKSAAQSFGTNILMFSHGIRQGLFP